VPSVLEKVTAIVTRQTAQGRELLLFEHPFAGIQFPAGTVEEGESPEVAAQREAAEETGLSGLILAGFLGQRAEQWPEHHTATLTDAQVYARPDPASFNWAYIRKGIMVRREGRQKNGYTLITYQEYDHTLHPQYISFQITGWVAEQTLARQGMRYFYHLVCPVETPPRWTVDIDHHRFTLFWSPVSALPEITAPQSTWLDFLPRL
jgi:8-oxo-dGTP pyrophosphatase MutT (NUDIX family)